MKIEPGCKCIIINSAAGNDGICVTAISYCGYVKGFYLKNQWLIDISVQNCFGSYVNYADESQLMRIDGYKEPEQAMDELVKLSQEIGL